MEAGEASEKTKYIFGHKRLKWTTTTSSKYGIKTFVSFLVHANIQYMNLMFRAQGEIKIPCKKTWMLLIIVTTWSHLSIDLSILTCLSVLIKFYFIYQYFNYFFVVYCEIVYPVRVIVDSSVHFNSDYDSVVSNVFHICDPCCSP